MHLDLQGCQRGWCHQWEEGQGGDGLVAKNDRTLAWNQHVLKNPKEGHRWEIENFKRDLVKHGVAWRKRISHKKTGRVLEDAWGWMCLCLMGKLDQCIWEKRRSGFWKQASPDERHEGFASTYGQDWTASCKVVTAAANLPFPQNIQEDQVCWGQNRTQGQSQSYKTKGKSTRALENVDALESNETEEFIELEWLVNHLGGDSIDDDWQWHDHPTRCSHASHQWWSWLHDMKDPASNNTFESSPLPPMIRVHLLAAMMAKTWFVSSCC
jgi:hypothetical protein